MKFDLKPGDPVEVNRPGLWPLKGKVLKVDNSQAQYDQIEVEFERDNYPVEVDANPRVWVSEKHCRKLS